jgi:hypothetical protein
VSIDVMLALIGPLIVWGLWNRRRFYAWCLIGVAAVFAALSFVSAFGFAAEGRDAMVAGRETERLAVDAAERKYSRLQAARNELGKARPLTEVEAALERLQGDERWRISRQCTAARQKAMAEWCTGVHRLNEERARAREAERLDAEIARATAELLSARRSKGGGILDSQIELIAELTGWPATKVRVGIVLLAASAMQLGAGLGLTVGLAPLMSYLDERKRRRMEKPQFGEHLTWGDQSEPAARDVAPEEERASKPGQRKRRPSNGRASTREREDG